MSGDAKRFSRVVTDGLDRAPHRAFLRAMGHGATESRSPFAGVVSTGASVTPCSMSLAPQVAAAKAGLADGQVTPFEFSTITVADSMSMNHAGMRYSLVSRVIIADSLEAVMQAHAYDGVIGFAACDKTLPGLMMGMIRVDRPSVFVYGGGCAAGRWRGADVGIVDVYEGVGRVYAGSMSDSELAELGIGGRSDGRFVCGPVHRQYDGDGRRSAWLGAAAHRDAAGSRIRTHRSVQTSGRDLGATDPRRRSDAARAGHARESRECRSDGCRHRRLDQRGAASAGDGARSGHHVRSRRNRRHLRPHAVARRFEARRKLLGARSGSGSAACRPCCVRCSNAARCMRIARPSPARPSATLRVLPRRRTASSYGRPTRRLRRPAASSCCAAISPLTVRCSKSPG